MRWEFQDPEDLDEARRRQPIVEAMDWWWDAFARNHKQLAFAFTREGQGSFDVEKFTVSNLKAIDKRLYREYGPAKRSKGDRLVITPEAHLQLLPMVRTLLRRAPKLNGWEFYPGRLPESQEVAMSVAEQISGFRAADLRAEVLLGKHRRVDLHFFISNADEDDEGARRFSFRAMEQLLGEEIVNRWLGLVDAASRPTVDPLKKRHVRLVGPDRLKATVDALLAASRDQLPQVPARITAQREDPDAVTWTSFELKPKRQADYPETEDLFFAATLEKELFEAALRDTEFYSGRYTRSDERFGYLKMDHRPDEQGHQTIDGAEARGRVEVAINATLGEHNVGCTWGGGSGFAYAYVFVALTDAKRAIPALREAAKNLRLHRRSWLLFFDRELQDEWVGLGVGTPPPPVREKRSR
jgi:hypothetical protein